MTATARSPRIPPLEPPYAPDIEQMLARWMPPGSDIEPLRLFRTLAHNQELTSRMRPLGAGILGARASVPPLLREIMIHRTCALTGNEYEWGVHAAAFGRPLGLTDEQLLSTVHGHGRDPCWDRTQATVLALADELHATSSISDELWAPLAAEFDERQIIELITTAGWYHVIAYICNGLRVQAEEWAPGFPADAQDPRLPSDPQG
jgi:4-carboxymuconolactone decarboxylase